MKNLLIAVSIMLLSQTLSASTESPYKGQELRSIKALSQSDINGYMTGKGMGFAKAAELNHYPGPRHVLDLSEKLELSDKQLKQTQTLFNKMQAKAINLGKQLIEHEQKLDQLFAQGSVDKNSLEVTLQDIGAIQAKLRNVHLSTHLEQKELLSKHQIMMYDRIRGYGAGGSHNNNHNHNH
ncbi:MAG: hypothetical protein V3R49_03230 [Gammaproteobacteria bacterium]